MPSKDRVMVAVKLMTPKLFDNPYDFYSEEVPYVRRLAVLLEKVLIGANLPDKARETSLWWVLLDHAFSNAHFVRRASIFSRDNNFFMRTRTKVRLCCGWADFSTV